MVSYDRSWWTHLKVGRNEAAAEVYLGTLQLGLDLLDFAGTAGRILKARKILRVGKGAAEVALEVVEKEATRTEKLKPFAHLMRKLFPKAVAHEMRREREMTTATKYMSGIMDFVFAKASGKWSKPSKILLRDAVKSQLEKQNTRILQELAVREHATRLFRQIGKEYSDRPEIANAAFEAIQRSLELALKKKKAVIVERADTLVENGVGKVRAKQLIRFIEKETRDYCQTEDIVTL